MRRARMGIQLRHRERHTPSVLRVRTRGVAGFACRHDRAPSCVARRHRRRGYWARARLRLRHRSRGSDRIFVRVRRFGLDHAQRRFGHGHERRRARGARRRDLRERTGRRRCVAAPAGSVGDFRDHRRRATIPRGAQAPAADATCPWPRAYGGVDAARRGNEPAAVRYLVTGAQGFVGRYYVAATLADDPAAEVLGIGRSPRRDETFTHNVHFGATSVPAPLPAALRAAAIDERYRYEAVDICDGRALTDLVLGFRPEVVVHLASGLRDDDTMHLLKTNLVGTIT